MAQCRRLLPEEDRRILRAMARPLLRRIGQYGWTHAALGERLRARQAQIGGRLGCDRSRVSCPRRRGAAGPAPYRGDHHHH